MAISFRAMLAGAAVAATMSATAASANPISFFYSVNGGALQQFGSSTTGSGAANFTAADNSFSINASGLGSPFLPAPNFNTTSNTVSTTSAMSITVAVLETGLSTPNLAGFNVSFTNNSSSVPVTMTFGTRTGTTNLTLASVTLPNNTSPDPTFYADPNTPATYSIFETYSATFGAGGGNFTATINERGVVPEPMSLALLGSGLVGLGLIRRKRA